MFDDAVMVSTTPRMIISGSDVSSMAAPSRTPSLLCAPRHGIAIFMMLHRTLSQGTVHDGSSWLHDHDMPIVRRLLLFLGVLACSSVVAGAARLRPATGRRGWWWR